MTIITDGGSTIIDATVESPSGFDCTGAVDCDIGSVDITAQVQVEWIFDHQLSVDVSSNIGGKQIKDGATVWYVITGNPSDTTKLALSNEQGTFEFTTSNETENNSSFFPLKHSEKAFNISTSSIV